LAAQTQLAEQTQLATQTQLAEQTQFVNQTQLTAQTQFTEQTQHADQLQSADQLQFGPAVLVSPNGEALLVAAESAESIERVMRAALPECGGWGLFVTRPFSAAELRGRVVSGVVSRAIGLGAALRGLPPSARGPQIAQALGGRLLGSGPVARVIRHPRKGSFGGGSMYLNDLGSGAVVRLEHQNEYLLAAVDGKVEVTCPDLLVVVDPRVRRLISPERVREKMEVAVVALEGPQWWKAEPERMAKVSPRAFGIDQDPIPWKEGR
jgi:DUF917 family protein